MVNKILEIARAEVGYKEGSGNKTKYGEAYGWNGVAWCVQFIWWLFYRLGKPELFYGGGKVALCSSLYNFHKKAGQAVTVSLSVLKPGDIVFFDFTGKQKNTSHVGIVEKIEGSKIYTIEGNTSSGNIGSQTNGEGVYRRERYLYQISCAYRPAYGDAPAKRIGYSAESFVRDIQCAIGAEVDGIAGTETKSKLPVITTEQSAKHPAVAHIQVRLFALGYKLPEYGADGDFGKETEAAVKKFQSDRGITADGEVGPNTFGELFKD